MILLLAFRNIFRSKTRTLLTISSIAFGAAAIILSDGFIESSIIMVREAYIRGITGHLQIARKGFKENGQIRPFDYLISEPGTISGKISATNHILYKTSRLQFSGLISSGKASMPFIGLGADPENEKKISSGLKLETGLDLSEKEPFSILVGAGLAEALELSAGTPVTLLATSKEGAINALDLTIAGIFSTFSKDFDARAVILPFETAQKLLRVNAAHTITVILDKTENTQAAQNEITAKLAGSGQDFEIINWQDLADFAVKAEPFLRSLFMALRIILSALVILAVFNTLNISVMERTGEIGTLMALGTKRPEILRLFITEGFFLGLFGGLSGVLAALALTPVINYLNFAMPPAPGLKLTWLLHITLTVSGAIAAFIMSIIIGTIASLYPALRASKTEIAIAMKHNQV